MTTKELCKQNYGRTWPTEMVAKLVEKGKLTETEYAEITGEAYAGMPYIPSNRVADIESQLASQDEAIIALHQTLGGGM